MLDEKYSCVKVGSAEDALERLAAERFNLVVSDIQMSGISGLELAPREIAPDTIVVMISGSSRLRRQSKRCASDDMLIDRDAFAIVKSIVAPAQNFKLETVAEGVETEAHAARLR